ncbi:glycosyltransferase family 2 protein [Arcobacter sp.]|uniref:glycosyltransferase family 2 protein n=1 Tax=Arcobacter sp. TaxID=1872629 RepID=UPI003C712070
MELKTNKQPLVTVIIPLYNAEKYISKTIDNVINQTYQNWEMIVVDDCSTDISRNIVKDYEEKDHRIKLIESESNFGGPARPRNIGVENAKGEYIAFLDADDIWLPQKLEKHLEFMKQNDLNFSSHGAVLIDEKSEKIKSNNFLKDYYRKYKIHDLSQLIKGNFVYLSSAILKKDIFEKFNEEKYCIAVEDYYLWLNLLNNKDVKYAYYPVKFLKYRIVNSSISNRNIVGKQKAKAMYYALRFILDNNKFDLLKHIKC